MSRSTPTVSVLFVCLGNICRSPTAEAVFRAKVQQAGLADRIHVDSVGTGPWHVGRPPDARAQQAARRRGYDLADLRGRQITAADLDRFDHVLVMDGSNKLDVDAIRPGVARPFLEFAPHAEVRDVPDPYAGGPDGFERVLDLIENAADGLLNELRDQFGQDRPGAQS